MDSGLPTLRMVLNLSAHHFNQCNLAERIAGILAETRLGHGVGL